MILSGVSVGDGAVIAARTVCTKNIPPYAIVAGNPGRIIRYRFDEDVIAALLEIRWWDWPIDNIHNAVPMLMQGEIQKFIEWSRVNAGLNK